MSGAGKISIRTFWGWVLLNVALWVISLIDGNLHELMLQAVDYAATSEAEVGEDRNSMAWSFVVISAAYFLVTTGLGAVLVHKSAVGRGWALLVLVPAALWWSYDSISSPSQLSQMYPCTIGWFDWFLGALGGVVWTVILLCSVRVWRSRVGARGQGGGAGLD